MNPMEVAAIREMLSGGEPEEQRSYGPEEAVSDIEIESLQKYRRSQEAENNFVPGDIVCWKNGLKNRTRPEYFQPCIILEVLAEPVIDETKGGGDTSFREPLDIRCGMIDRNDGDLLSFWYSSRNFQRWVGPMTPEELYPPEPAA